MSETSLQTAQRLATLLSGTIKGISLYPPGHPAVTQPMETIFSILRDILQTRPEFRIGIDDGSLVVDTQLFVTPPPSLAELIDRLAEKEITGITIARGIALQELKLLISLLARKGTRGNELNDLLRENGATSITIHVQSPEPDDRDDSRETEARETYHKTLDAIRGVFLDIEAGRIPNSENVITVVNSLVTLTMHDSSTLLGLAMIKDYDNYTFNHSVNVGILAMALGAFIGMESEELRDLGTAGLLHDIGKTLIDKDILNKPGKLSAEEFEVMKSHCRRGYDIIKNMDGIRQSVGKAILGHHIQFDRRGYPESARQDPFDRQTEILAIADCYDALTTLRAYQHPHTPKAAIDLLRRRAGTWYDAALVEKFVEMMGSYPVGSLVRLDTSELAVVLRPNPANWEYPTVKVIVDKEGIELKAPRVERLLASEGDEYARIVAIVDPLQKNIDVARYLT